MSTYGMQPSMVPNQCLQDLQAAKYKRPRNSGSFDEFSAMGGFSQGPVTPDQSNNSKPTLKLPQLIDLLARDEQVIRWDDASGVYEVMNGPLFEERFNALRCTRGKRNEEAVERPFARMHSHFVLVRGGRWAATGTTFRPLVKSAHSKNLPPTESGTPCSPPFGIDGNMSVSNGSSSASESDYTTSTGQSLTADMVNINLSSHGEDGSFNFQCTLQHFLDITGAGELYHRAIQKGTKEWVEASSASANFPGNSQGLCSERAPMNAPLAMQWGPDSTVTGGNPQSVDREFNIPNMILSERDIVSIVGTMWDEGSLGDQAYFFFRESGTDAYPNGSIISLVDGHLKGLTAESCKDPRTLYLVVSDNNAKWKGEPIPTKEEESLGHWCAFLGQVPVKVEGPVCCGDFIGPKGDGSGLGVVTAMGRGSVIGIALATKPEVGVGVVKTLCFAGFNALAPLGEDFRKLFNRFGELESKVESLRENVEGCERRVAHALDVVSGRDEKVRNLESRMEVVERRVWISTLSAWSGSWSRTPSAPMEESMGAPLLRQGGCSDGDDGVKQGEAFGWLGRRRCGRWWALGGALALSLFLGFALRSHGDRHFHGEVDGPGGLGLVAKDGSFGVSADGSGMTAAGMGIGPSSAALAGGVAPAGGWAGAVSVGGQPGAYDWAAWQKAKREERQKKKEHKEHKEHEEHEEHEHEGGEHRKEHHGSGDAPAP